MFSFNKKKKKQQKNSPIQADISDNVMLTATTTGIFQIEFITLVKSGNRNVIKANRDVAVLNCFFFLFFSIIERRFCAKSSRSLCVSNVRVCVSVHVYNTVCSFNFFCINY